MAPAPDVGEAAHDADQLLAARVAAGERPPLVADVIARGRGREAEGARLHRLAQEAPHGGDLAVGRRALERRLAHDVVAQRRERDEARHVDAEPAAVDGVEVLAVALPLPVDARLHDVVRNGLDVHQVLHEDLARLGLHGRHADAAVPHDHGGDAVPRRAGQQRIPGDLGVVVRVGIDEAGRQDEAVGVEHALRRLAVGPAEIPDDAVLDPEGPHEARRARPVADPRVLDQEVQHEVPLSLPGRSPRRAVALSRPPSMASPAGLVKARLARQIAWTLRETAWGDGRVAPPASRVVVEAWSGLRPSARGLQLADPRQHLGPEQLDRPQDLVAPDGQEVQVEDARRRPRA